MNIAKAKFAAAALRLEIDFRCHDVRLLSEDECYDLVLCFGLLYHLDARSAVRLVETIGRVRERLLVLDTHFSLAAPEAVEIDGRTYRGHLAREYAVETTAAEKAALPWSSLDNDSSFWLSKPSILNLLARVGFNTRVRSIFPAGVRLLGSTDRKTNEVPRPVDLDRPKKCCHSDSDCDGSELSRTAPGSGGYRGTDRNFLPS